MKSVSWAMLVLGVFAQLFYSFSALLFPSMASADGTAVHPPATELILQFAYRALPYALFGSMLVMADMRFPKWRFATYLGVIVAVLSPLLMMAGASAMRVSAVHFREGFWPIRPVLQIVVFLAVVSIAWLGGSSRAEPHPH